MEAFWIVNLSENKEYAANYLEFKENYKAASGHTFENLWYEEFNFSDSSAYPANSSIRQKLELFIIDSVQSLPVRWPYFQNLGMNGRLKIIIIGDLDEMQTRKFFHLLPTEIRKHQRGVRAFPLASVEISGLLSYNHDAHHKFSEEQTLFLTQLNLLMKNQTLSLVPYDDIFFFQKPAHEKENHYTRISQYLLATVLNSSRLTPNHSYNEAGSSGIYFEKEVQTHNEASLLSAILLNSFNFKTTRKFLDPDEADRYVKDAELIKNGLLGHPILSERLKEKVSQPDFDRAESGKKLNPLRSMFHASIITDYYYGFIPRIIQKLVNHCGSIALHSYQKFLITLQQNKLRILNGSELGPGYRTRLIDIAFGLFKNPELHCSLEQQRAVIVELQRQTEEKARLFAQESVDGGSDFRPFTVPKKYQHAYDQARRKVLDEDHVLKDLESNLKAHPVISAKLIRAVLLGLTFLVTVGPLLAWMTENRIFDIGPAGVVKYILWGLSLFFPLVVAFWQIRGLLNRIRMYQDQYKACLLARINEKAQADLIRILGETYSELAAYCEVLEKRRQRAAKHLQATDFRPNNFKPNKLFQPAWESMPPEIHDRNITFDCGHPGKFSEKDILSSFPGNKLRQNGEDIHFTDLMDDEDKIMELIRELMNEPAPATLDSRTEFVQSSSINAILLLDISGSMVESMSDGKSKIEHLREAVNQIDTNELRWVAFSNDVYKDGHGNTIFSKSDPIPDPGGGTELEKGFQHLNANRALGFEKIILVSDGLPFDQATSISEAKAIGIPVDVIYIGTDDGGKNFMQRLADETNGKMVVASDVNLLSSLRKAFTIEIRGRGEMIRFWELLKLGYYPECALVAHEFAGKKLIISSLNTSDLINDHHNPEGIKAWIASAEPSCTLRPGLPIQQITHYYTGGQVFNNAGLVAALNATYLRTPDAVVVGVIKVRNLQGLTSLLLCIDQVSEEQVFSRFVNDETTELCKSYLGTNQAYGIFPGSNLG